MFYLIPAASSKLIEHLVTLVLKAEKALLMEVGNNWFFRAVCNEGQNTKAKIIPVTSQRLTLSLANENLE